MKRFLLFLPLLFPLAARAQGWNNPQSNTFATCLVRGDNGDFWAGADDEGLFHRDTRGTWSPFAGQAELGDASVTCVAVDSKHRVWVGTASAGVAVWNGANWKRFGVLNGPLSGRVNDLKIASNGDVWGATDAGVFSWTETGGWSFPGVFSPDTATRKLAQTPVYSLAFDSQNRVLEACDEGLNRLTVTNGDATIEAIGRATSRLQPPRAGGEGFLPGPVHAVAVDSRNQIWCATRFGVCVGKEDQWHFLRGADWLDNAKGSALPLKIDESNPPDDLLAEDWVTTLAPTTDGKMWLGFRQKGAGERDCQTLELIVSTHDDPKFATNPSFAGDWTSAIVPTEEGAIFARYGGGLASLFGADLPAPGQRHDSPPAPMPLDAAFLPELLTQLAKDLTGRAPLAVGEGARYSLDRQTRGDWPLRYGNAGGELFATGQPRWMDAGLDFHFSTAPHLRDPKEADFFDYTHWDTSDNPNVLQLPSKNIRRQSEFNDGSWQDDRYPPSFDGPDLWTRFTVPAGLFRVSYYWFNKDGHSGINRQRDHRVELFAPGPNAFTDEPMARARLWSGWNGEYVSFAVRGPADFRVRFVRDRSHATQLHAFFFDRFGTPGTKPDWLPAHYELPVAPQLKADVQLSSALNLWSECNQSETRGAPCPLERLVALRAAKAFGASESLLAAWRVQAGVWDDEGLDRKAVALPDAP